MNKKTEKMLSGLIGGFLGLVLVIYLVSAYPGWALALFILFVIGAAMQKKRCQVCNNLLGRNVYEWTLDGKKQRVCSHCNQSLQKKNSREAMKRRG